MKLKPFTSVPFLLASAVIVIVCLLELLRLPFFEWQEWKTYDWRVRLALRYSGSASTNLGFVSITDQSLTALKNKSIGGMAYGLYWPRHVYGRVIRELSAQGADAVAFDIIFGELRRDHAAVPIATEPFYEESDVYFAHRMSEAGNVILASTREVIPPPLFRTNALMIGDISAEKDADGVLRRTKAFHPYGRKWHPVFLQVEREWDVDLERSVLLPNKLVLYRRDNSTIEVPLADDGTFDLANFVGDKIPSGMQRHAAPFQEGRVWQMGIALAARALHLDLENAEIDLQEGTITLRGPGGIVRVLPVDHEGYFYIDWCLKIGDPRLTHDSFENVLKNDFARNYPEQNPDLKLKDSPSWRDKLVVIGSTTTGNDWKDLGATPLEKEAHLMSKHWNIANSIIQGRFIRQVPLMGRLAILVGLGVITALLTWKLHALPGSISVLLMILSYTGVAVFAFVHYRYWLPLALPTVGSLLMMHLVLVIHRVRIEQTERNRIRSIFSRMVSPNIVQELLQKKKLAVDGARRELTVFFADIRQFTQVTDLDQSRSIEQARRQGLEGEEAEHWLDEQAREILDTVNLYLATIADMVKKYNGTLDKYIGDCVMAFWGAPAANPNHARDCVRAAMDAQRAVALLNRGREAENRRREEVNRKRGLSGEQPLSMLPVLQIGTGINTGVVTVGLMGSEEHNFNYTVFGREVNLASRLETASGHGRIYIGEATYQQLLRTDSELASSCVKLPPLSVKGFHEEVSVFEVPWQGRELHAPASTETTSRPASGQPADATPSGDPAAV